MTPVYVALIADAIASRQLPPARRAKVQSDLRLAVAEFNQRWRAFIAAEFAVTRGDEVEVLLTTTEPVWDIAHGLRRKFPEVDWIVACGRGPITTPLDPGLAAPEVDGPCFHHARAALEAAKEKQLVFAFGGFEDPRLEGFAHYYSALYWSWTRRQRQAANGFRFFWDRTLTSLVAEARPRVLPSALSHLRRRMAWPLVEAGDAAFRTLLEAS